MMIKCPECGKEISDKAKTCPNCGCPITNNSPQFNYAQQQQPIQNQIRKDTFEDDKPSKLSIFSLIFSILGCTFWLGLILAIIDLIKRDGRKKICSIIAIVISIIWLLIGVSVSNGNKKEETPKENVAVEEATRDEETEEIVIKNETEENYNLKETYNEEKEYEAVFFYTLIDNIDEYKEKDIRTTIQVRNCNENEDESYIESEYSDYDLVSEYNNIKIYPDNYQEFESGEYITVVGKITEKDYSEILQYAHIIEYGEEAKKEFDYGLSEFQKQREEKIRMEKEEFIEKAETPTYDDLLRYPDTYKEKKIKIIAKIVRVEPDGIIFDGEIEATMGGESIAVYDNREIKEPKFREGDSVTIYGYGKGTTTVKVQDTSGFLPKTIDKYDIPAIDVRHIDFN